jgi:Fe-S-cluster containining protein
VETEMPLLKEDIDRIINIGYKDFFEERDGYIRLKNVDDQCIFLKNGQCSIYMHRPTGCRLYPAIYDADTKIVILDKECPHYSIFGLTDNIKRDVEKTIKRLIVERT